MSASPSTRASLTLENRSERIADAEAAFTAFAGEHALPDAVRRAVQIALDDALQNIVTHAYPTGGTDTIAVTFEITENRLVITIADRGVAFDMRVRAAPDVDAGIEERAIGGLGILLVQRLMDEVDYRRHGDRNELVLVKHIAGGSRSRGETT